MVVSLRVLPSSSVHFFTIATSCHSYTRSKEVMVEYCVVEPLKSPTICHRLWPRLKHFNHFKLSHLSSIGYERREEKRTIGVITICLVIWSKLSALVTCIRSLQVVNVSRLRCISVTSGLVVFVLKK